VAQNGEVTLTGNVRCWTAAGRNVRRVGGFRGVLEVIDRLEVVL
jgi:osmotically-inducible protein OsmY